MADSPDTDRHPGDVPAGDDWTETFAALSDEGRRRLLAERPALASPAAVEELSRQALKTLRVELARAEALADAARWLGEELRDERSLALGWRALANVAYLKGRHQEARERYEAALEAFRRVGDDQEAAITLSSSMQTLAYLGRYDEALAAAAAARRLSDPADRLFLARVDSNEGNVLFRQDRFAEALDLYESAGRLFRKEGGDPQDLAAVLYNLATSRIAVADFTAALGAYRELSEHCATHELPLVAIRADYNIAYLHYLSGDYAQALRLYEDAYVRCDEAGDDYHRALCDLDRAEIYIELNLMQEAERSAARALGQFRTLSTGYEAAKAVAFMAVVASQEKKSFQALDLFRQARDRFEAEGNRVWMALIDLYRALLLHQEGRPFEARSQAEAAHEFLRDSPLEGKTVICELLLARIHTSRREHDEALAWCRAALGRLEALDQPTLAYQVHFVHGQVHEALGGAAAALAAYREAYRLLESPRSHLRQEELKVPFLGRKEAVYESLVSLRLAEPADGEGLTETFLQIEQSKSRAMADLLAFGSLQLSGPRGEHSELVRRMRELREELNWYYRRIDLRELELAGAQGADASGPTMPVGEATAPQDDSTISRFRARTRQAESGLVEILSELRQRSPELAALQAAGSLSLDGIRAQIPEDAVLLAYYEARGTVQAAVLGHDSLEIVPLAAADRVRGLQRQLLTQQSTYLKGPEEMAGFEERFVASLERRLSELYRELIAPVSHLLRTERLIVTPHRSLHHLPFHALLDEDRRPLIADHEVSYAASASVFAMCRKSRERRSRGALVLAAHEPAAPADAAHRAVVDALAEARVFLGGEATAGRLREHGPEASLLHLVAAGFSRRENPLFSSIHLADSELTLFDLYGLELGAELVVVDGYGDFDELQNGDELVGLTRGLLYAGAGSVLVPLWPLDEESSGRFMAELYRRLGTGLATGAALRRTILAVREERASPYFWAPFALNGDPESRPALASGPVPS